MTENPSLSVRQKVKLGLFALIPLLVLFGVAHVIASVATHRKLAFIQDPLTGATSYKMTVGGWPWVRPSVTLLNAQGFPDDEFGTLPSKRECIHIVFTGDSFTFGDAVDGEKSWVSLVRLRLATGFPSRCVKVFNIAAPRTTIEQQLARVRETKDLLQPDYVILGQYQNDLTDLTIPGSVAYQPVSDSSVTPWWGERVRSITPGFDSPLPRMLTYRALRFLGERGVQYDILKRWSVLADPSSAKAAERLTYLYGQLFDTLVTELRRDSIEFATVIFPSKMDVIAKRYPEGDFFGQLAEKHGVPSLSIMPVLDANRRPFPFLTYDGHLNERGNRIAAATVLEWLFASDSAPFTSLREKLGTPRTPPRVESFPQ